MSNTSNTLNTITPITLETWVNQNGQTVTVIRGLLSLDVHGRIIFLVQDNGDDRVLLVHPDSNKGQIAPLASLKKEGYTLQPEEASPPPPALTAFGVEGPHINWGDIN